MRRSHADGLTLAAISGVERRRGGCASTFCGTRATGVQHATHVVSVLARALASAPGRYGNGRTPISHRCDQNVNTAQKTAPCSDGPKPLPVHGGGAEQAQKSAPIRKMQDADAHPVSAVNLTASADLLW